MVVVFEETVLVTVVAGLARLPQWHAVRRNVQLILPLLIAVEQCGEPESSGHGCVLSKKELMAAIMVRLVPSRAEDVTSPEWAEPQQLNFNVAYGVSARY